MPNPSESGACGGSCDKVCIVLGAMPISDREAQDIREALNDPGTLLICADAGLSVAQRHGIVPHLIMGDFDSLEGRPPEGDIPVLTFPVEKDDTDSMLAAKEGLARGYRHFRFYGSLGGRLDHTLANISMLRYLLDYNATGWILSEENCVTLLQNSSLTLQRDENYPHLSVFSYEKLAEGVVVQGGKYTPQSHALDNVFPLGVSNSIVGQQATVSVEQGVLLIVRAK